MTTDEPTRWVDSGRAVGQAAVGAFATALLAGLLMLVVPAHEFPLSVDRVERFALPDGAAIEVRAQAVDVRFTEGNPAARLSAEVRRTFLQSIELSVVPGESSVLIEARYVEGLSWGLNPRPVLELQLPAGSAPSAVTIDLAQGGEIDTASVPAELLSALRVQRR